MNIKWHSIPGSIKGAISLGAVRGWWLLVRLFFAVTVLAIIFVVFQPLVWRWRFPDTPPPIVENLATLMSLVVALIGLGVAVGGYAVYQIIGDRIRKDVALETKERLIIFQYLQAYIHYTTYQNLWATQEWQKSVEKNLVFKESVNAAVVLSRAYMDSVMALPEGGERTLRVLQAKNSLAYDLASQNNPLHKVEALALAKELEREAKGNVLYLETVSWVLLRFCEDERDSEEWKKGHFIIQKICANTDENPTWRQKLLMKYNCLFNLELPRG